MDDAFEFTRHGRSRRAVLVLALIYGLLLAAVVLVDAAVWLMAVLALLTLPALWDLWRNPSAGVRLDATRLEWHSGRRAAWMDLAEIDHMRLDTRWDFSVRATAVPHTGKRVRLPFESLPPHRAFETTLTARGVRVERHHFSIL
jgi:hypothetical protein